VCTALVSIGPGSTGRDLNKPQCGTCSSVVVMASGTHRRHTLARLSRHANELASVLFCATWLVYSLIQEYQHFRFGKSAMVERTTLYNCVYTGILPRPTLCTRITDWVCTGSEQAALGLDAQMMRGVWWRRDEPGSTLVASVSTSTSSAWLFTKASCLPLLTCALSKQHTQLLVSQYYTHYPA
jgi:hypothetical protein